MGNLSALLLAGERFRRIIPGFVQTCLYTGFACIKFRCHYHPAGSITFKSAVGKLAAFVTELVYCGTDLRYVRAACEIQSVTGSETTVRSVRFSRCCCCRYCRRSRSSIRENSRAAGNQERDHEDYTYRWNEKLSGHVRTSPLHDRFILLNNFRFIIITKGSYEVDA
jgi:hypothetical protein